MQGANLESARIEIGRDHARRKLTPPGRTKAAPTVILELRMRWGTNETPNPIIAGVLSRRNPQKFRPEPGSSPQCRLRVSQLQASLTAPTIRPLTVRLTEQILLTFVTTLSLPIADISPRLPAAPATSLVACRACGTRRTTLAGAYSALRGIVISLTFLAINSTRPLRISGTLAGELCNSLSHVQWRQV